MWLPSLPLKSTLFKQSISQSYFRYFSQLRNSTKIAKPKQPLIPSEPVVLFENNNYLVVNKPCGINTQPVEHFDINSKTSKGLMPPEDVILHENPDLFDKTKRQLLKKGVDLVTYFKLIIKHLDKKPGEVFLSCVNRLDKPVSGLIIIAKKSKSADRFAEEYRNREVEKEYLAIVEGDLLGHGKIEAGTTSYQDYWQGKPLSNKNNLFRSIAAKKHSQKKKADGELLWSAIHQFVASDASSRGKFDTEDNKRFRTIVGVKCSTGAKHQIRRQLAYLGHPIVGDWLYGSKSRLIDKGKLLQGDEKILLHASKIKIREPTGKRISKEFFAPVPKDFLNGANIDITEFGGRFYDPKEAKRVEDVRGILWDSKL